MSEQASNSLPADGPDFEFGDEAHIHVPFAQNVLGDMIANTLRHGSNHVAVPVSVIRTLVRHLGEYGTSLIAIQTVAELRRILALTNIGVIGCPVYAANSLMMLSFEAREFQDDQTNPSRPNPDGPLESRRPEGGWFGPATASEEDQ